MSVVQPAPAPCLSLVGNDELDDVMQVMRAAFDPNFGEAWTRTQCAGILAMSGVRLTLARVGSEPAGFSLTRAVTDEAELLLLAVSPQVRRRGIGSVLLDEFMSNGVKAGLLTLHLEVRESNPAVALYSRYQFNVIGRRPKYYRGLNGEFHDALTMARSLNGNC